MGRGKNMIQNARQNMMMGRRQKRSVDSGYGSGEENRGTSRHREGKRVGNGDMGGEEEKGRSVCPSFRWCSGKRVGNGDMGGEEEKRCHSEGCNGKRVGNGDMGGEEEKRCQSEGCNGKRVGNENMMQNGGYHDYDMCVQTGSGLQCK